MSKVVNNSIEFPGASIISAVTAGLCSSLVGIGLSRFAFSPLIPPLVSEHWFAASQAAYLGAANLLGYVLGALISLDLARAIPVRPLLEVTDELVSARFLAGRRATLWILFGAPALRRPVLGWTLAPMV